MKVKKSITIEEERISKLESLGKGNLSKGIDAILTFYDTYDESMAEVERIFADYETEEEQKEQLYKEIQFLKRSIDKLFKQFI